MSISGSLKDLITKGKEEFPVNNDDTDDDFSTSYTNIKKDRYHGEVKFLATTVSDVQVYQRMWEMDPEMAKQWIDKRILKLKHEVDVIRDEIKILESMQHHRENKYIKAVYRTNGKRETNSRSYGDMADVKAYMARIPGEEVRPREVAEALRKEGKRIDDKSVNQCLHTLFIKGILNRPYRGVYKMKEE